MKTPMFNRYIRVPKCCMSLPFVKKCLPCQNCVRAWDAYHTFCDRLPLFGDNEEDSNYPYFVPEQNKIQWEAELDTFIDQEVKKQKRVADPIPF